MNKKTHKLKIDSTVEYTCLGVASTESEFQLSLFLNSILSIKITLAQPIIKELSTGSIPFPCFKFDQDEELQLFLIKNKHKGTFLFQNQQTFDFIILLSGSEASKNLNTIKSNLNSFENISLVSQIEIKKLGRLKKLNF